LLVLLLAACASSRVPQELKRYDVLVEGTDDQSRELARELRAYGMHVRDKVRGGSGPTAALIHFTFGIPEAGEPTYLHLRLADTRSGVIIRAGTVALDSLSTTPRARAIAAVRALMVGDSTLPSP
jgi:hypothetical protein